MRKFGWIMVVKTDAVGEISFIKNMGEEFLDDLTLSGFKKIVSSTDRGIKTLLMDQKKVAGVGNIYANDALFLARIHPERKSKKLSDREIERLFNAIETVLKKGLKAGGASENTFVTPDGEEGKYQDRTLVYGKKDKNCPNGCGGKIKKSVVGGRGTYFCPKCQK
jgi:formamidopyrimidine-DNA glycosylase